MTLKKRTLLLPRLPQALLIALSCLLVGVVLPAALHAEKAAKEAPSSASSAKIDLNHASPEQLESLPGIGPSKAAAIISLRQRLKGFNRIEQLLRVKGIGRKTFRRLREHIALRPMK